MSAVPLSEMATSGSWQADFMAIVPNIQKSAKIRFRHMRTEQRAEAIAESIAAACVHYQRLAVQGQLHRAFVTSLADHSVRHAAQHRHIGGHQSCRDVMSPLTRRKRGVVVSSISAPSTVLIEDRKFGPAETAAIRLDFNDWINRFNRRDRRVIEQLAMGDQTSAVAGRFGLSPGRISQMRRRYEQDWRAFQGEEVGQC